MVVWRAYVVVDEPAYAKLNDLLGAGSDPGFGSQDGAAYLTAASLDACEDAAMVAVAAGGLVGRLNGLLRLHGHLGAPVRLQDRYENLRNQTNYVYVTDVLLASDSVLSVDPPVAQGQSRVGQVVIDMAARVSDVDDLLRVLGGAEQLGAVELYKAFEIIRDSLGGQSKLIASGLVERQQLSAFTASLNRPDVLGDKARHGRMGGDRPKDVMSLPEARAFLLSLANRWVSSLMVVEDR